MIFLRFDTTLYAARRCRFRYFALRASCRRRRARPRLSAAFAFSAISFFRRLRHAILSLFFAFVTTTALRQMLLLSLLMPLHFDAASEALLLMPPLCLFCHERADIIRRLLLRRALLTLLLCRWRSVRRFFTRRRQRKDMMLLLVYASADMLARRAARTYCHFISMIFSTFSSAMPSFRFRRSFSFVTLFSSDACQPPLPDVFHTPLTPLIIFTQRNSAAARQRAVRAALCALSRLRQRACAAKH